MQVAVCAIIDYRFEYFSKLELEVNSAGQQRSHPLRGFRDEVYGGRYTGKRLNITCPLCFVCACFFVVLVNSFPTALRLCFACLGGRRKGAHHGGKEKPLRTHPAVAAPAAACGAGAAWTDAGRLHHGYTQRTL